MFNLNHTLMQLVVAGEFKEFTKSMTKAVNDNAVDETFVDGNVLYKTMYNRSSLKELLKEGNSLIPKAFSPKLVDVRNTYQSIPRDNYGNIDPNNSSKTYTPLFKQLTDKVLQFNNVGNVTECINVINEWRDKLGTHFYGAVIRDTRKKSIILNPLHILTTLNILANKDGSYFKKANFDVLVYFYPDRDLADEEYSTKVCIDNGGREKAELFVDSVMQTFVNRVNTIKKVTSISNLSTNGKITASYQTAKHVDESLQAEYYVVAHQILTNGTLAPFYGTSLVRLEDNRDAGGVPLGPIRTCNISDTNIHSRSYNTVCTGNHNNKTLTGLRSLTHAFLGSAFTSLLMEEGSLVYIDVMVEKSIDMFKRTGVIKKEEEDNVAPEDEASEALSD